MAKKKINGIEYSRKINEYYKETEVKIKLGDLDKIMTAASRMIKTAIEIDNYTCSGICVETKEIAQTYKKLKIELRDIRIKAQKEAEKKVYDKYIWK